MVQTLDSATADAVAKLENVSNALRARGLNVNADQIKEGVDVIVTAVSNAMCSLAAEEIVMPGGVGSETARVKSIESIEEAHMVRERVPQASGSMIPQDTRVNQAPGRARVTSEEGVIKRGEHPTKGPGLVRIPNTEPSQLDTQNDGEAGALFLEGNFNLPNLLHFVTSPVNEGPLFEVIVSPNQSRVTIIFQHSLHAGNFLRRHEETKERTGLSLYGRDYTLTPGPLIPWDEQIRAMGYPSRERRRLTFARAGLFSATLTPDKFKEDMVALVGKDNVVVTWVFNAGNATVIFRSTGIARIVYQYFRRSADGNGISSRYIDADVTYSTDPCEKPLVFSTQLQEWQVAPQPQQTASLPQQLQQRQNKKPKRRGGARNPQEIV